VILTESQLEAVVDLVSTDRRVSRLHGYAGTGKTSAVATRVIQELLDLGATVQVLAPTGKAARVLRSKGLHDAATIHSYLYTPSKRERPEWRETWEPFARRALEQKPKLQIAVMVVDEATSESVVDEEWEEITSGVPKAMRAEAKSIRQTKRYQLAFTAAGAIAHYEETGWPASDVLVIDEASMVSEAVALDLERTGSRLIYIGDPAQLPPVAARPSRDAMGEPHHLLTQVHRQKGDSDVLKLATRIRKAEHPIVDATKPKRLMRLEEYDQVLCWRNATRERVNAEIRRRLRRRDPMVPEAGDKLVCIKNTKPPRDADIRRWMNGEQVTVLGVETTKHEDHVALWLRDDEGIDHEVVSPVATLGGHRAEQEYLDRSWGSSDPAFAYGFALTVHKSQGSEWPTILLVDETPDMISVAARREGRPKALAQARQWLYTGITRARDRVDVVHDLRSV